MEKAAVREFVGRRVAEARALAGGMTQEDLAARLGVRFTTVSMIETGANAVTVDRLLDIAAITEQRLVWFFPREAVEGADFAAVVRAWFPGLAEYRVQQVAELARLLWEDGRRSQGSGRPSG